MTDKEIRKDSVEEGKIKSQVDNIKFMLSLHGGAEMYVSCLPEDEGALKLLEADKWVRKIDIKPGVEWQLRSMRNKIREWLYSQNIGMEFINQFLKFIDDSINSKQNS